MRTPAEMIVGLVLCPCGLLLTLTGTLAPSWRQVSLVPDQPMDVIWEQGIWDICRERQSTHDRLCGQADELGYFEQVPVRELWALPAPPGSTLTVGYSLVLSYLGSCLEILGGLALALSFHHCCKERRAPKLPPTPVTEAGSGSSRAYNNPWDVFQPNGRSKSLQMSHIYSVMG
ncbi:hypothetical protein EK904_010686 [Melospiza melodia maxima]|nr:hypothetical protein EK904_010686 [Melospiza melodia maxima]